VFNKSALASKDDRHQDYNLVDGMANDISPHYLGVDWFV
jgi:hypothetical protein